MNCGHCEYCRTRAQLAVRQPQGARHELARLVRGIRHGPRQPGLLRGRHRPRHARCSPSPRRVPCTAWRRWLSGRGVRPWSSGPDRPACCCPSSSRAAAPASVTVAASSAFKLKRAEDLGIDRDVPDGPFGPGRRCRQAEGGLRQRLRHRGRRHRVGGGVGAVRAADSQRAGTVMFYA